MPSDSAIFALRDRILALERDGYHHNTALWWWILGRPDEELAAYDCDEFVDLVRDAGGWWHSDDEGWGGLVFVPIEDWQCCAAELPSPLPPTPEDQVLNTYILEAWVKEILAALPSWKSFYAESGTRQVVEAGPPQGP